MSPCIKHRLTQIFGTNYNKCGSHFGATVSSGFHCIANEAREKESDGSQLRPTVTRSEKRKWDKYAQNENKLSGEKPNRKKTIESCSGTCLTRLGKAILKGQR